MKILFLTHSFPYPPDEGIKIVCYNLIKELSKRHSVTLLSFINLEKEKDYISVIKNFCERIETVEHNVPKSPVKRIYNILFQKYPFCIYQFYSDKFTQKLIQLTSEEKFDVIHFDFVNTSFYRSFIQDIPGIFFPHDAMSMLFYRNATIEGNIFNKLYFWSQYKKMVSYEKENIPKFKKTVVVSPKDMNWLLNIDKNFDIIVIPNGVDANYFKPMDEKDDYPSVIFRGIMNFYPNIDSVIYFAKEILPIIRKEIPDLKFYIVGPNPTAQIKKLAKNPLNIVTGYVEDIRPYIWRTTVNICPMRIGSGIKNKILEAMAMEKSTVTTSIGVEGIPDVTDGENILVADTPEEFAKKTILLLKDEILRKKIGKNGREFVMKNYTWEKVAKKFEEVYKEAILKHGKEIASLCSQ